MIIDFSNAVEGEFYTIDESIPLDVSLIGNRDGKFLNSGRLTGWYTFFEDSLAVNAELEYSCEFACDRCLAPTIMDFKIPVTETFYKDKLDEETLVYEDEQIELQPIIAERVLLAMPSRVLCKKDCKGLCDKCGANLNIAECKCNIENRDSEDSSPFSVLKNMNINAGGATNGSTKK